MLVPSKFPSQSERETLTTLSNYSKLYDNNQFPVLGLHEIIKKQYKNEKDLVYISHPLPSRISDFYGDFVAGDTERMVFRALTEKTADQELVDEIVYENDLKEKIGDLATTQSAAGFAVAFVWKDEDDIIHIDEVAPDQYFPQADGSVIFGTYKLDPEDAFGKRLLLYTQHFTLEPSGDVVIKRQAWTTDEKGIITGGYDINKMSAMLGKPILEEERLVGLNELPIRQIDNGRRKGRFGKSDYADIMPQLAEINERATHISTVFLKNLDAKMQLPAGMKNADGKVEAFDYILMESKDTPEAKYITNQNPLLTDAREHMMTQLKTIETATSVPLWALTKGSMPERVEALKIQLFAAVRRTERKRAKIKRAIQDLIRIGFKLRGMELDKDVFVQFSDPIPTDAQIEATTEQIKVQAGLSSRKSSIMRLENYSEEEAEAELEKIKEEDVGAGFSLVPPTL